MVKDPLGEWGKVYTFCALLVDLGHYNCTYSPQIVQAVSDGGHLDFIVVVSMVSVVKNSIL